VFAHALEFAPEHDAEIFEAIPSAPAVFLLAGEEGAEPYVSKTANLKRRLVRLLGVPDERTRRLNLRERVRRIEYTRTGSDFESTFLLYQALRRAFPKTYRDRLRLRLAPLIKFNVDNPYPRAYVTQRITASENSVYYGPFPTRAAAEQFLNDSLDLFKIRRCDFEIHPDPKYPGCIYSEMKMCLAPCFAGCTDEEYQRETARVREFFDTGVQSLVKELTAERERASEALEFESAAALHARIEKITAAARLPEIVRRLDRLAGIMVQPAAEDGSVALFRIDAGCIYGPMSFPVQQAAGKPLSMEARIEEMLGAPENQPKAFSNTQRMEHLAILKRWYFRTSKTGEIFFTDDNCELPLRRIVRGVSRVFRGEKAESDPMHTAAREYWLARTRAPEAPPES
jgi:excinuclease UvrABC nuclease subunit